MNRDLKKLLLLWGNLCFLTSGIAFNIWMWIITFTGYLPIWLTLWYQIVQGMGTYVVIIYTKMFINDE